MSEWEINPNGMLSQTQIDNNITLIVNICKEKMWSQNAIAGLLGNIQPESGVNPARWENDNVGNLNGGLGLIQWTPATKIIEWIKQEFSSTDYYNGNFQMERITLGKDYSATSQFKLPWDEWIKSDRPPGYLAAAYMLNAERPLKQGPFQQWERVKIAEKMYQKITGHAPKKWIPPAVIIILKRRRNLYKYL